MIPRSLRVDGIDRRTATEMSWRSYNQTKKMALRITANCDGFSVALRRVAMTLQRLGAAYELRNENLARLGFWQAAALVVRVRWRLAKEFARLQWHEFRRSCKQTRLEVGGWRPVPGGDSWFIEDDKMELL